jgi:hypothetical protein
MIAADRADRVGAPRPGTTLVALSELVCWPAEQGGCR